MTTALTRGLSPARKVLDYGAVVIVQETSTTPAVTILATFLAGGLYEPLELPGLAYFTGRVLDRGTERRSAEMLSEQLDDRGVALKVSMTRHTMSVSCTCLADDFDDLLSIVLDVARRPVFPENEIAKRRAELITAIRQDRTIRPSAPRKRSSRCFTARRILTAGVPRVRLRRSNGCNAPI